MTITETRPTAKPLQEELDRLRGIADYVDEAEMTLLGLSKQRPEAFRLRIQSGLYCPGVAADKSGEHDPYLNYWGYWTLMEKITEAEKGRTEAYAEAELIYSGPATSIPGLMEAEAAVL